MAIVAGDLKRRLSVKTGAAGNSTAGTAAGSLGKYISTTDIVDATDNNLFDDVTGDENAASDVEYRCEGLYNSHGSLHLTSAKAWLSAEVATGTNIAIGLDTNAESPVGQAGAQFVEVADESTAPSGVSFSAPTSKGTGLSVGTLSFGYCKGLWWRRTAANSAALAADGATVRLEGDSAA